MQKELVVLVGPQGSGKSTLAQIEFSDYFLISQDYQGKAKHYELFLNAIKLNYSKIIVDRINHTREQRRRYLKIAKNAGYKTRIIVINKPFEICLNRILERKVHPTLDYKSNKIDKALQMYFKEYEIPEEKEADVLEVREDYDPYFLDLSKSQYQRFIIIGDIHGCYEELLLLLKKVNYDIKDSSSALIFVGDLIDKGPEPKKVFDFVKNNKNAFFVMGNHEFKLLRYLRGNNVSINHGLDVSIKQFDVYDINKKHSIQLRFFLEKLPYIIKLPDNSFVVHAGINPFKSILEQRREHLLFIRNYNPATGKISQRGDPYWFEEYGENLEDIYFGHNFHEEIQVRKNVFALDGYCVYGGELRACILEKKGESFFKEFVSVKALNTYYVSQYQFDKDSPLTFFDDLVKRGYLKSDENDDLVIYNYTDKTTFEKYWTYLTKQARGLIFEKKTGMVIARPFEKFFNIGENDLTQKHNLPLHLKYRVLEKLDGSLAILYFYKGSWLISTKGRLDSQQAKIAQELLYKKYKIDELDVKFTYLLEIVHPKTKVIIDYKDKEELYLLSAIETLNAKEVNYDVLVEFSKRVGFLLPKEFNLKIDDLLNGVFPNEILDSLNNLEGFVIRFDNNYRVKFKLNKYLEIARIRSHFSKLSLFKVMKGGKIPNSYLEHIPEEFNLEAKKYVDFLEGLYREFEKEIGEEFSNYVNLDLKQLSEIIKNDKVNLKHKKIYFDLFKNNKEKVDKYILSLIKEKL